MALYGSPAGYEFATLIEDIRMASRGTTDLSAATVETLNHLTTALRLQVFVTPTCPYCPRAALLAHKMALVSDWVTADAVDATEFPELADHYRVRGVPRTIVKRHGSYRGRRAGSAQEPRLDLVTRGRRPCEESSSSDTTA